jgi:CRP-like cAMP-binding protein
MYAITTSTRPAAPVSAMLRPFPASAHPQPKAVDSLGAFGRLGTAIKVERNRAIYFEGDDAEHCYRVVSGMVRLCKVTEDGRRQIAAFLIEGDLFAWTDQEAYQFSAEAVTDVTVEKFSRARIDEAVKDSPSLGRTILAMVSGQLAAAHDHLLLLGRMTASERIATFLIHLRKRQPGAASGAIELAMNRTDFADDLGLTVETVSRVMNGLKRRGVIAFAAPENVQLKQSGTLERLAMAA